MFIYGPDDYVMGRYALQWVPYLLEFFLLWNWLNNNLIDNMHFVVSLNF